MSKTSSPYGRHLANQPTPTKDNHPENDAITVSDLRDAIDQKWDERVRRPRRQDTTVRVTFQMDEDLKQRLDVIAERRKIKDGKIGFKQMALNAMIRRCLNEYEEEYNDLPNA